MLVGCGKFLSSPTFMMCRPFFSANPRARGSLFSCRALTFCWLWARRALSDLVRHVSGFEHYCRISKAHTMAKKKKEKQKRKKNEQNVVIVIHFSKEKILAKSMVIAQWNALWKLFQIGPCWLSYLHLFRNGIRMKTGGQKLENSLVYRILFKV